MNLLRLSCIDYLVSKKHSRVELIESSNFVLIKGISHYVWCIGSIPDICDTTDGDEISDAYFTLSYDADVFTDGRHYYLNLQVCMYLLYKKNFIHAIQGCALKKVDFTWHV